jgi:hypothetical protein
VFALTGCESCAEGLTATNWSERHRQWLAERPRELPPVPRPSRPFADWQGPVGEQAHRSAMQGRFSTGPLPQVKTT